MTMCFRSIRTFGVGIKHHAGEFFRETNGLKIWSPKFLSSRDESRNLTSSYKNLCLLVVSTHLKNITVVKLDHFPK